MKQSCEIGFLFIVASILSVLAFPYNLLIIFKVVEPNNIKTLLYIGWIFWISGIILVILAYYEVYYRKVNLLIDSGIYAVVRHPLYLGWILSIFVTSIFFYQHWIFLIIGILGIGNVYLITKQEDQVNIEKFGDDYKHYMQNVPGMNFLVGIIKLIRYRNME